MPIESWEGSIPSHEPDERPAALRAPARTALAGYAQCWPAHEARRRLGVKELTVCHGACAAMSQALRRQSASRASKQAVRAASRARTSSSRRATSRRGALVAWAVGDVAASADGSSATDGWAGAAPAGELVIPRSRAAGQQCDEPDKGRLVVGRSMVLGWSSRRTAGHRGALSWTAPFAGYRRVRRTIVGRALEVT